MTGNAGGSNNCVPLDLSQNVPSCPVAYRRSCIGSLKDTGSDLAGPNMHVGYIDIKGSQNIYYISIDMLEGVDSNMFSYSSKNNGYICNNTAGQQYCATSLLSTVAARRLN